MSVYLHTLEVKSFYLLLMGYFTVLESVLLPLQRGGTVNEECDENAIEVACVREKPIGTTEMEL
jgi:hypothetical protein